MRLENQESYIIAKKKCQRKIFIRIFLQRVPVNKNRKIEKLGDKLFFLKVCDVFVFIVLYYRVYFNLNRKLPRFEIFEKIDEFGRHNYCFVFPKQTSNLRGGGRRLTGCNNNYSNESSNLGEGAGGNYTCNLGLETSIKNSYRPPPTLSAEGAFFLRPALTTSPNVLMKIQTWVNKIRMVKDTR